MAITNDNEFQTGNLPEVNIPYLPIDVVIHIMSYLSVSDRMAAGLVSRAWREASLTMKFADQQALVFGRHGADNLNQMLNVLQHSSRPFYHFVFTRIELKKALPIWEQFGSQIQSLIFVFCDLSERTLVDILKSCENLRVLHINTCRECLMSGRLLDNENDVKVLSEKFQKLHELCLANNRYLSDALFNRLVAICPNLESLSLIGCQISFHCGLYKKFYPKNNVIPYASESVLTFLNILHYITQQAEKLKHLDFGYTLIDGTALATLSALKSLKLKSLELRSCDQLTIVGIRALVEHQPHLRVLDISMCTRVTDVSLLSICKNLKNLESLNIRRCRAITDYGIQEIRLLKKLKELDISECEQLTGKCIIGLCRAPTENSDSTEESLLCEDENLVHNHVLQKLSVYALNLDEKSVECIAQCFPNLRVLNIGYCFNAVTDKTIQMIFKELTFLRTLEINYCDKVSDAGLTGMGAGTNETSEKCQVECIPEYTNTKLHISLRSRAEEEIVRDATRKREVMKLCEDVSKTENTEIPTGFSMIRLRGLRKLDLYGCNRITDVSLKHAFAFLELRVLDLSKCQQITHVGLDYLTRNNYSIEDLNLSYCYNISDEGVSYVAQRLHRLKNLYLQGCSQLSDRCLDSIKKYCKSLQHLDVRYCQGMTIMAIENVSNIDIEFTKPIKVL